MPVESQIDDPCEALGGGRTVISNIVFHVPILKSVPTANGPSINLQAGELVKEIVLPLSLVEIGLAPIQPSFQPTFQAHHTMINTFPRTTSNKPFAIRVVDQDHDLQRCYYYKERIHVELTGVFQRFDEDEEKFQQRITTAESEGWKMVKPE